MLLFIINDVAQYVAVCITHQINQHWGLIASGIFHNETKIELFLTDLFVCFCKGFSQLVHDSLKQWQGEQMPISRSWVEQEVDGLEGNERAIARLALVVAKASYQTDDNLVAEVLASNPEQEQFLRILAWSTFTAARYVASRIARLSCNTGTVLQQVA